MNTTNNKIISESQIDRLVKLVLSEERKKRNILPETWERAPAGKPKDPIGYWKALYDNLKKNGFPVQYQYANDPAKSGFMRWGSWIISKDLKVNGGYPIYFYGSDKKYYHFKFKDGIYRGTSDLSKLMLSARFSSYSYPMNYSMFKKSQKEITDELNKDIKVNPGVSAVWSDLYAKLNQYKPSNVKLVKSDKGDAYFLTNYHFGGAQLGFWQNGDVKLYDKTSWKSIGKWDPSMQKDGKLAGGWLKRNNGEKVSLGPALNEPNVMPMPFLLISAWNNKSTTKKDEKGFMDNVSDFGKDAYDSATKTLDSAVNWTDKNLRFDSDWWLLVPGLNGLKLTRDQYKAFRFFQTATPDQMIEGIRDFLGGVKGSVLTIGLDAVGVGEIAEPIIWSLMLAYDCYKYVEKGILNLIDIIADCAAILSAGLGAWIGKAWKGLAKPAKEAGQEVHALIKWVQNNLPTFYPYIQKVVKNIDTLIRSAATNAKLGLRTLKQKLPVIGPTIKAIEKGITYIPDVLDKLKKQLTKSVGESGQKMVMSVGKDRVNALTGGYAGYVMDPTGKLKKDVMKTVLGPSIWGNLKKSLGSNKSPTLKIQDASNGDAYYINGYGGSSLLGFFKNGGVKFWNGKSWSKGGKWDPKSANKDGQLIGSWLTDKTGKKVSLGPAISNAYKYFG